jgi:hypothetical protein
MRALKMTALLMVVTAAILVPLYSDSRGVTHPEWARMLVRALELEGALPENAAPAQVFSALSWKNSLAFTADRYQSATGIALRASAGASTAVATPADGEIVYPLIVITGGDYRVRARLAGDPGRPAVAEIIPSGQAAPAGSVTLSPTPVMGWVDGGAVHLDRGAYSAIVRLPAAAALESLEVAPPCVSAVEPLRGWAESAVADTTDVAVTVVKAIDRESELPAAAPAVEVPSATFHDETVAGVPGPRRSVVFVDLPEAGLYTISAFGLVGSGQGWTADACRKAIVCAPVPAAAPAAEWRALMTAPFSAGRHVFTVTLRDGAVVERLRAEKKKNGAADYVETLRRLGFDVGEAGPVSRPKATEAMAFVHERAAALLGHGCGDLTLPDAGLRIAGLQPASLAGPGLAPGDSGAGPNPIGNPAVPLDFTPAAPSPAPPPTTTPAGPTPAPPATPAPTPPTPQATPSPIPQQPPGSGVTPTPPPL